MRNKIGFTHSRNRLTAVEGKWYTKVCVSVFQIAIICSEKGKFLEVFEIRDFSTVCKGGTRLRPNLHIDMRHDFLAWNESSVNKLTSLWLVCYPHYFLDSDKDIAHNTLYFE